MNKVLVSIEDIQALSLQTQKEIDLMKNGARYFADKLIESIQSTLKEQAQAQEQAAAEDQALTQAQENKEQSRGSRRASKKIRTKKKKD